MAPKLKPCPFCGATCPQFFGMRTGKTGTVRCVKCRADGPPSYMKDDRDRKIDAAHLWNKRK